MDDDFDWKAAYGQMRAKHQRAAMELIQLRAMNAALIPTLDELNRSPVDLAGEPRLALVRRAALSTR